PALSSLLFISVLLHPPTSPLSPYTTLFRSQLNQLIQQLDGLDIIVLNAGISASPEASARETDLEVIAVNITGLANIAAHSFSYLDRKSTRLNSSHVSISYAVFCLKKKKKNR